MHLSALLSNCVSYRSLDRHDSRANYITKVYTSTRPSLNMVVLSRKRITYGQIETPLYDRLQPSARFYYKSYTAVNILFYPPLWFCDTDGPLQPSLRRWNIFFYFYDPLRQFKYEKLWLSCSTRVYSHCSCLFAVYFLVKWMKMVC